MSVLLTAEKKAMKADLPLIYKCVFIIQTCHIECISDYTVNNQGNLPTFVYLSTINLLLTVLYMLPHSIIFLITL